MPKEFRTILTVTLACFFPGRAKDLSAAHVFIARSVKIHTDLGLSKFFVGLPLNIF